MNEDFIIKVLALLIAAFLGFAKLVKYDPQKEWKEDLLRDLDVLSKLDEDNRYYKTVSAHVHISLLGIYHKDHHPWYSLKHRKNKVVLGIPLIISALGLGLYFI